MEAQTTAISGGPFNPPLFGHYTLIEAALTSGEVSKMWVLAGRDTPQRQDAGSPFSHRLEMCRRLALPLKNAVMVRDDDRAAATAGLTLRLLLNLARKHSERRLDDWLETAQKSLDFIG